MQLSFQYIQEKIAQAGIVGAGGAGFPAHIKINQPADLVIANGAECEPLLASDIALIKNKAPQIVAGLILIMNAVRAREGIIAIKAKHSSAIKILEDAIEPYHQIYLHLLDDFYPAGDEQTLIYEVTGKRVPPGGLPSSVGVLVHNVTTLYQAAEAFNGRPLISRYVTVTGEVRKPAVVEAPIGTPLIELIEVAGGSPLKEFKVITGGPMMGRVCSDTERETTAKTMSGLIILPPDHFLIRRNLINANQQLRRVQAACENCRMCTDLCPRFLLGHPLEPHRSVQTLAQGDSDKPDHIAAAQLCCLCGICDTVACPCNLSPRALYFALKQELSAQKFPPYKFMARPIAEDRKNRKISVEKVMRRLDIIKYADKKPEFINEALSPKSVRIKLQQHIGAAAIPVVKTGDRVIKGQLIGDIPEGKMGARIHASINGIVTKIDTEIFIENR